MDNEEEIIDDVVVDHVSGSEPKRNIKKIIAECILYVVIIFTCAFIVPEYVLQRTIVKGTSMENTLHDGDNLLVEKVSYHFTDPGRFDIVVFYPNGREAKDYYVKRVIGLPGEKIQIIGNDIYINDEKIEENYGKDPISYAGIAAEPIVLKDDEFFVMGDNRTASYDSRYMEIGPVTREKLSGRVIIRIYPFNSFGIPD